MILWRVSNHESLDGRGGLMAPARWHSKGRAIVYCASSPAAALLKMLVHSEITVDDLPRSFRLIKIEAPDDIRFQTVLPEDLEPGWPALTAHTRYVGDRWLTSGATALLQVPSVLVPETFNVLINPAPRDSRQIRVITVQHPALDPRLIRPTAE